MQDFWLGSPLVFHFVLARPRTSYISPRPPFFHCTRLFLSTPLWAVLLTGNQPSAGWTWHKCPIVVPERDIVIKIREKPSNPRWKRLREITERDGNSEHKTPPNATDKTPLRSRALRGPLPRSVPRERKNANVPVPGCEQQSLNAVGYRDHPDDVSVFVRSVVYADENAVVISSVVRSVFEGAWVYI